MSIQVNLSQKSPTSTDDAYSYRNTYLDADLVFEPLAEEEVISIAGGEEPSMVGALNDHLGSSAIAVDLDRGFVVRSVSGADRDGQSSAPSATAAQDALAQAGAVVNSIPVMVDSDGNRRYFMPDEITVQFRDGVSDAEARAAIASLGSAIVEDHRTDGYYTVTVPEGTAMFESIRLYSELESVEFAEPSEIGIDDALTAIDNGLSDSRFFDRLVDADMTAFAEDLDGDGRPDMPELDSEEASNATGSDAASLTEPDLNKLWGLRNFGQSVDGVGGTADADIDGTLAWSITKGAPNVVVAVIDTGADLDHPDLQSRLLPRGSADWDFADPSDSVPQDSGTHGTHCSGTAVGASNNAGTVGVAPGARLMPLRINLSAGMNANRADAINYVATRARAEASTSRRYVINCSWRASGSIAAILRAIRRATASNVVVVFAAGNSNRDMDIQPQFPGAYPEVISVAATDQNDHKASFSNFGSTVDVSAPGVNIWSSIVNDSHGFADGTSMAAPHVAGLAALIWSRNETLSAAQVRQIIEDNCDSLDVRNPSFVGDLGRGRINAYRSLRATPAPVRQARVVRSFPFPQANNGSSSALAFVPGFRLPWRSFVRPMLAFLTQQPGSEDIYFMDAFSGAVRRQINPVANETIGSMTYLKSAMWVANVTTGSGAINRISTSTGQVLSSITAPAGRGEGLTHDGTNLVYSTMSRIHLLNPNTGAVRRSFASPGGSSRALAADGDRLFVGNSADGKITVWKPRISITEQVIEAPGSGTNQVEGLAYDRTRRELYVANQSENRIYVIRV